MGQRKFRLSDMMPNSWFYKLRDMRRAGGRSGASVLHRSSSSLGSKRTVQPAGTPRPVPASMPHRSSYYYASMDRELIKPSPAAKPTAATEPQQAVPQTQSPARSSRRRHRVGPVVDRAPAPVAEAPVARHRRRDTRVARDGGADDGKVRRPAAKAPASRDVPGGGKVITSETDIIFDLSPHPDDMPERVLRPIVTRPARKEEAGGRNELRERHVVVHHGDASPRGSSASEQGNKGRNNNSRRSSVSSSRRRLKTRANSPRLQAASRCSRKTTRGPPPSSPLAESFAVVKASMDPRRDFRESMEEMIAEKGIRGAADLEDLLACYLALNDAEHHGLIVEVFEDIWRQSQLAGANP